MRVLNVHGCHDSTCSSGEVMRGPRGIAMAKLLVKLPFLYCVSAFLNSMLEIGPHNYGLYPVQHTPL